MYKLELGSLYRRVQEEITGLTQIREVYNAANKVIAEVNLHYPGITKTELASTRIVADTTEDVSFQGGGSNEIDLTTDQSSSISPGDIIVISGSTYNDGAYIIQSVSTTTITIVSNAQNLITPDASDECTYGIFRPLQQVVMPNIKFFDVTFAVWVPADDDTITVATPALDLGVYGIEAGDIVIVENATESGNNGAFLISAIDRRDNAISVTATLAASSNDTPAMKIVRPWIGYAFNVTNHSLILANWVKKVVRIFENDIELTGKEYREVKDSDESDELNYNMGGSNSIYLPSEIFDSASDELQLKVVTAIPEFLYSMNSSYIEIPKEVDPVLFSGVMKYLLVKPKYKEDTLLKTYKDSYETSLNGLIGLEGDKFPRQEYGRDYTY